MTTVIVVHTWSDSQKPAFDKFAGDLLGMAKGGKLPKGLQLKEVFLAKGKNMAVCRWEVDSLDHLMQVAGSMKPSWKLEAYEATPAYQG
ncbi:MAG: hypothetical protein ACP5HT_02440 [Conexivisphaera sp.]|jgi:hypothetical protein